jgi:DNA-binding transcriptional regulator YhcF (GntR family)/predicted kinase
MTPIGPRLSRADSLHQQVARNIRNEIEAGILRHGQLLPSTRELAEQWDVSVFTINEAMKVLTGEGLVISKSRAGRTVNAPDQEKKELRTERPQVLLVGGYAGSGKSELGRIIARETGWPLLDKDTLTRPVVEFALQSLGLSPHDRESDRYVEEIRPREYEALEAATVENAQCGNSVIVTAPFVREFQDAAWVSRTRAAFGALKATTSLVWIHCDAETMHTYLRHRSAPRDAYKLSNWPSYLDGTNLSFRPPEPFMLVENSASSEPLKVQAARLIKTLAQ